MVYITVGALGGFAVTLFVPIFKGHEELFIYILEKGPVQETQILTDLWPDWHHNEAVNELNSQVNSLNTELMELARTHAIIKNGQAFVVNTSLNIEYDVFNFLQIYADARKDPLNLSLWEQAAWAYGGKFFESLIGNDSPYTLKRRAELEAVKSYIDAQISKLKKGK